MLCSKYDEMEHTEQKLYTGSLIHCVLMDNEMFEMGKKLIEAGNKKGLFNKIKIGHQIGEENQEGIPESAITRAEGNSTTTRKTP